MSESISMILTSSHNLTTQNTGFQASKDPSTTSRKTNPSTQHGYVDCDQNKISLANLQSRSGTALKSMRQSLTGATIDYLRLGGRYFEISSKARSSIPSSNPAQLQYGIEGRRWDLDPFFAPSSQALRKLNRIEAKLAPGDPSVDTVGWMCDEIDQAQSLVREALAAMSSIEDGVEQIEDAERIRSFEHWIMERAQARAVCRKERDFGIDEKETRRGCRRKRENKVLCDAERRHLHHIAFEQPSFENWKRRVEGFERMEEMEV